MSLDLDPVVQDVLASRRYRHLAPDFVRRIATGVVRPQMRGADAAKETKRKLHQVFGAYVQDLREERIVGEIRAAAAQGPAALQETSRQLMAQHASSRERLPILDRFYQEVFAATGTPATVQDLACGFGPLALPWMALPPATRYCAYDIDARFVAIARASLEANGTNGFAELRDVIASPPEERADVALLLKSVPCLEQQARGSARHLLDIVRAEHVVVSFPTRSLGGAGKGMVAHYREVMAELAADRPWAVREVLFPVELVFIVTKEVPAP